MVAINADPPKPPPAQPTAAPPAMTERTVELIIERDETPRYHDHRRSICRGLIWITVFWLCIHAFSYRLRSKKPDSLIYCDANTTISGCPSKMPLYFDTKLRSTEGEYYWDNPSPINYDDLGLCPAFGHSLSDGYRLSTYDISFLRDDTCKVLCAKTFDTSIRYEKQMLRNQMKAMLDVNTNKFSVDKVPVRFCFGDTKGQHFCQEGLPLGCHTDGQGIPNAFCLWSTNAVGPNLYLIFNHLDIEVYYRPLIGVQSGRIKAVRATFKSIDHDKAINNGTGLSCDDNSGQRQLTIPDDIELLANKNSKLNITYTYSVKFIRDDHSVVRVYNGEQWRPNYFCGFFFKMAILVIMFSVLFKTVRSFHNRAQAAATGGPIYVNGRFNPV